MKISVIMQSYLGEYPGSRTNPKEKFIRAVNSFLAQKHEDKELIIVADKCQITMGVYNALYKDHPQIKCFYYEDENSGMMYQNVYRGRPKQFGIEQATGDMISYLDSDDFILPNHLLNVNNRFEELYKNGNNNILWGSNALRFLNAKVFPSDRYIGSKEAFLGLRNFYFYNYGIHEEFFLNLSVAQGRVSCATYSLFHMRSIETKWIDLKKDLGVSEDFDFCRRMNDDCGPGVRIESPTYVVCHYRGIWDS